MRVCIVTYAANPFGQKTGGSERQSSSLARALAARGHDVTYIAVGWPGEDLVIDGVKVRPAWNPHGGIRYVRAVTHRYPRLLRVLRSERADVFYARGAGYYTPFVMRAARDVGARSLLALASDRDLYPAAGKILFNVGSPRLSAVIGPVAHAAFRRWGLRAADCVVVQNQEQAEACQALGLRHALLPSIVATPPDELVSRPRTRDVVWSGNVFEERRSKGLEHLVTLAKLLPRVTFTCLGKFAGASIRPVLDELSALPNVALDGLLEHPDALSRVADHRLVVNTSPSEGFSNVMLEGWSLGIPAVTLAVNPSGLLNGDRLGICARGDLFAMAAGVSALLAEKRALTAMGARARSYVLATHAVDQVCDAFERLASAE